MLQVESALEFARICRKLDFHNFVFLMKASNPVIMVQAYRLLVAEMYNLGWDYPLHVLQKLERVKMEATYQVQNNQLVQI